MTFSIDLISTFRDPRGLDSRSVQIGHVSKGTRCLLWGFCYNIGDIWEEESLLLETPRKFTVMAGTAEGPTRLNAFDNALLDAGIGNLNLLRVSSILPPNSIEVAKLEVLPGSLLPTAYGTITSETPGEIISAAVAVGIGESDQYGVIMEFSGRCSKEEAEETVHEMARAAFRQRDRQLTRVIVRGAEHRVESIGCAFAAVALWY